MDRPSYFDLEPGEIRRRAREAVDALSDCRLCPRDCGADRLRDRWGACKTGRRAVVSSHFAHFGEEDCLRGWNGSGTIFFAHCNLRCQFCQNSRISWELRPGDRGPAGDPPERIADRMLDLQERGCHNINFVTPEHVVPQVLEAVADAVERGLELPIVYNTSAYDALESLRWMDGIVDVYMPDLKLWSPAAAKTYLMAEDYPEAARAAVKEMHRQVGDLEVDAQGLARRGLLVRHLVMPELLDETRALLEWIADELGPGTYVNLMDQYYPAGRVGPDHLPEIDRELESTEFAEARAMAADLGLRRLDERRPHRRLLVKMALRR